MSYFPKPSLNENDLAIIERGATAAHSIEAGQYVSWHGRTGKAKAAILQGATLSDSLFDYDEDGILNASIMPKPAKKPTFIGYIHDLTTWTPPEEGWYFLILAGSGSGRLTLIYDGAVVCYEACHNAVDCGAWIYLYNETYTVNKYGTVSAQIYH